MARSVRTLLILVLLLLGADARARTKPLEVVSPARAEGEMQAGWDQLRDLLSAPSLDSGKAQAALNQVLEGKWDGGFGDLAIRSLALIEWAEQYRDRGDREAAEWLMESALRLSPRSSVVQFAAGRYYLAGGGFNPTRSLGHYLDGLRSLDHDFPTLFWLAGLTFLAPVLLLAWFGAGFGLTLAIRYFGLLAHDLGDLFPGDKPNRWLLRGLALVILFLPFAAALSPWWVCSWWMVLFFLYMQRSEKLVAVLWFLSLLAVPPLLERHVQMEGTRADPVLQAAVRVQNGVPESTDLDLLRREVARKKDDPLARFSLARLLMRQGTVESVKEAANLYTSLTSDPRLTAPAYNNLAEIYYAAGDLKSVFDALAQAEQAAGPLQEITYNRSQYYDAMGQVSRRDEEAKKVRDLDQEAYNLFVERTSAPNRLNRVFVPLDAPASLVIERAFESSPVETAAYRALRAQWMGVVPPPGLPYYGAAFGGIFGLFLVYFLGRNWRLATACTSCGKPVCRVCQPPSKAPPNLCLPCFTVFRGQGGDLKDKMSKRVQIQRHRDLWRWSGQLLGLALPGAGHLLLNHPVIGSILFLFTSLVLAIRSASRLMWPLSDWLYHGGLAGQDLALGAVYLLLVVIALISYRARTEDWR